MISNNTVYVYRVIQENLTFRATLSLLSQFFIIPEAVPSINFIGRQLDVSYIGRQMYG